MMWLTSGPVYLRTWIVAVRVYVMVTEEPSKGSYWTEVGKEQIFREKFG